MVRKLLKRILLFILYDVLIYIKYKISKSNDKFIDTHINISRNYMVRINDDNYGLPIGYHMLSSDDSVMIQLDNGDSISCSAGHIFVCVGMDGTIYQSTAADLYIGEKLYSVDVELSVINVEYIGRVPMMDITMPSPHTYVTNGVLSHNTITVAIYIVWYIINNVDKNVMIISQNGDKVKELMDKINVVIKGLPFYMKPGVVTDNVMTKVYDNGCKIVAQTTSSNSGASFTIHLLYIDEFALISPTFLNEFYRTVYPVISSSKISQIIITSTPRGMNKFYEIYTNAVNGVNSYNPIRVDWYDVDGRDEKWKQETIADLGSEEDFNQEFGNQFTAGSKLLFKSAQLKWLKNMITTFVNKDLTDIIPGWYKAAEDGDIETELHKVEDGIADAPAMMKWHPKFDPKNLSDQRYQYVISIDIADGDGGDYFVANFFQILPMSEADIDKLKVFGELKDFFRVVQVGIYRTNEIDVPQSASFLYHMLSEAFACEYISPEWGYKGQEYDETKESAAVNVMLAIEINKEGRYFIKILETINGDENLIETDLIVAKTFHRIDSVKPKMGLLINEKTKNFAIKRLKNKVTYKQLIISEKVTVEETLSMATDSKGKLASQLGNDDAFDTARNITLYMETDHYKEQIEQMIPFLPKSFLDKAYEKLKVVGVNEEDDSLDDIEDLIDVL